MIPIYFTNIEFKVLDKNKNSTTKLVEGVVLKGINKEEILNKVKENMFKYFKSKIRKNEQLILIDVHLLMQLGTSRYR